MQSRDFYSHVTPEGRTVEDRLNTSGYLGINLQNCNCNGYNYSFGENIFRGRTAAAEAIVFWMDSAPHKANMLSAEFDETGIGNSGEYWAQTFGNIVTY